MKKIIIRVLVALMAAAALILPAQALSGPAETVQALPAQNALGGHVHASPGQEKLPKNLKWAGSTVCVQSKLDKTWDPYLKKAAAAWGAGSKVNVVVKYRTSCGTAYKNQTVTIADGDQKSGTLATTSNSTKGKTPALVIIGSKIVLDTDKFWSNNPATRQPIVCHELGHSFGIAHYVDKKSCMNTTIYAGVVTTPHARDLAVLKARYGKG